MAWLQDRQAAGLASWGDRSGRRMAWEGWWPDCSGDRHQDRPAGGQVRGHVQVCGLQGWPDDRGSRQRARGLRRQKGCCVAHVLPRQPVGTATAVTAATWGSNRYVVWAKRTANGALPEPPSSMLRQQVVCDGCNINVGLLVFLLYAIWGCCAGAGSPPAAGVECFTICCYLVVLTAVIGFVGLLCKHLLQSDRVIPLGSPHMEQAHATVYQILLAMKSKLLAQSFCVFAGGDRLQANASKCGQHPDALEQHPQHHSW